MIRALLRWLCALTGHGPFHPSPRSEVHEGELRRMRRCGSCGADVMGPEVDG